MAIDVTLNEITTGYNLSKVNQNFQRIGEALEDALSRSGSNPNTMSADLDMNGNDILNTDVLSVTRLYVDGEEFVPEGATSVGPPGEDGEDATITVGSVTTGPPGTSASVVNVGTVTDAVFNFVIPRGDTGASGAGSGDMVGAQNLADVSDPSIAFANIKQAASDTLSGVIEIATNAEVLTGTDAVRAVTPASLQAKIDALPLAGGSGYRFLGRQSFTASGTYTPTAGTTMIHVIMCGGGGGGGGANAPSGVRAGGGGSAAETCDFILTSFTSTVAVTIGSGGTAGSSAGGDGGDGGTSQFGSYATAIKGLGGSGSNGGGWGVGSGADRSSSGTIPAGGLRFQGGEGGDGVRGDGGSGSLSIACVAGTGGSSYFGGGGNGASAISSNSSGRPGGTYGAGGGGGASSTSSGASGGAGAGGVVIIYEYTNL